MSKVYRSEHNGEVYIRYACPGCKHDHAVPAVRWNWNEDMEKPTLSPSVRHFIPHGGRKGSADYSEETLCHYFIREGRIEFCGDCKHTLAGQTIELPEVNPEDVE